MMNFLVIVLLFVVFLQTRIMDLRRAIICLSVQSAVIALACFISGQSAPKGKRMGHAGAIISGGKGTASSKIEALEQCGALVAPTPDRIGEMMETALKNAGIFEKCLTE